MNSNEVKVRYVELEPNRIFNLLDPKNLTCWIACPELKDSWWEPETIKLREQFGEAYTEEFDRITKHFTRLEESIRKNGMLHPINAVSGHLRDVSLNEIVDDDLFPFITDADIENVVYSHTFGGSRVTIAEKLNIPVPCAVHDFSNLFEDCEEITKDNFNKWFGDSYSFIDALPHIRLKAYSHIHIDEMQYKGMTHHTKMAQKTAINFAKEKLDV